jgi:hypothetical protein
MQGTGDEGGGAAAVPTDLVITSTPCQAGLPFGAAASVTFSVTSSLNPELITGVALQLSFPTVLWPAVTLACQTASGAGALSKLSKVTVPLPCADMTVCVRLSCLLLQCSSSTPYDCITVGLSRH